MKKYLLLILFLLIPFSVFGLTQESYAGVNYYIYKPANATTATPVIFAFHGVGTSSADMGAFGVYNQIESINPNAIVIIPMKGNHGAWNTNTYSNFARSYVRDNGFTGTISYYGFSMGAIDAPKIIPAAGVFTNAVLVDEHFIGNNGGIQSTYNKLSSLSSVKVFCGKHCDDIGQLNTLSSMFSNAGKSMQIDSQPSKEHGQMNSYAASPGIGFLTGNSNSGSGGSTIPSNPSGGGSSNGSGSGSRRTTTTTSLNTNNPYGGNGYNPKNPYKGGCPLGEDVTKDLSGALRIMRIMAPIFVLTYTIYDVIVVVVNHDVEGQGKKMFSKFGKRVLISLLLFVIPTLVDLFMQFLDVWDASGHCSFENAYMVVRFFIH